MSVRQKAIIGFSWNLLETLGGKFVQVLVLVILARLLEPQDFGLIALLVIFTELAKVILNSGFAQALVREKHVSRIDLSSVFYINLLVGLLLYCVLYFMSPFISNFYEKPELTGYSRLVFLVILINSFMVVQSAILTREMRFKSLSLSTLLSSLLAGIIAIYLAYNGWGVRALITQLVLSAFFRLILLCVVTRWLPSPRISIASIKRLFKFSKNILASGILDAITSNLQSLLIGKFYTVSDLGLYSQSRQLSTMPSQMLTSTFANVSYSALTKLENYDSIKRSYRKILLLSFSFVFPLMMWLSAIGDQLLPLVLGEQWKEAGTYFQIFCIAGAFFPLYIITTNIFLVLGDSGKYLRVNIIKRIVVLVVTLIAINFGVLAMVFGYLGAMIFNSLLSMIISGKELKYSLFEQVKDIYGVAGVALIMIFCMRLVAGTGGHFLTQAFIGVLVFIILSFLFRLKVVDELGSIAKSFRK
ncbi:lipopolysaccharide biosynthesis protein [Vreelandella profundi]|uniref:lipopolysaccharide biosynthesis protein n=1 Tax=Vreelandella profundi TaxID=2852117 RepID=UPI001F4710DF|nr:lipopolysaccharide biosynthesis protein [Halomonas profundi]